MGNLSSFIANTLLMANSIGADIKTLTTTKLNKSGGIITGVIDSVGDASGYRFDGRSFAWNSAMQTPTTKVPHIMQDTYLGWDPILGIKTTDGFWQFGAYQSNALHLGYMAGAFGSHATNAMDYSIKITPTNVTIGDVGIMSLNVSGNVGIGTTSPDYKLEVIGDIATLTGNIILNSQDIYANKEYSGNDGQLRINRLGYLGGTTTFRNTTIFNGKNSAILSVIGSTGNVGIGTTAPSQKLEVIGNVTLSGDLTSNKATIGNRIHITQGVGGRIGFNRNTDTGVLYNTGIAAYQIQNTGTSLDILTFNDSDGSGNFSFKGGKFGINTSSPSEKLHVVGNGLFTGTLEVDTVNNGVGDFLTRTSGGVITRRTAAEVRGDIGAQPSGNYVTTDTPQTISAVKTFTGINTFNDETWLEEVKLKPVIGDVSVLRFYESNLTTQRAYIGINGAGTGLGSKGLWLISGGYGFYVNADDNKIYYKFNNVTNYEIYHQNNLTKAVIEALAISASSLTGTLADARLSNNVVLENIANTFTQEQYFNNNLYAGDLAIGYDMFGGELGIIDVINDGSIATYNVAGEFFAYGGTPFEPALKIYANKQSVFYENVGIGIDPAARLHLFGNNQTLRIQQDGAIAGNSEIYITSAGANNTATIRLQNAYMSSNSASSTTLHFGSSIGDNLFKVDGGNRKVGVNVVGVPTEAFEVNGNVKAINFIGNLSGTVTNGVYTTNNVVIERATVLSTTTTDFNTITTAGTYQVAGTNWTGSTNSPILAYTYGQLVVTSNGNIITQIYYTHQTNGHFIRSKFNTSDWTAWQELLSSSNYNSFSPTLTGTGASGNWNISASQLNNLASTDFVRTTGTVDQIITGLKTFYNGIVVNSGITINGADKALYVKNTAILGSSLNDTKLLSEFHSQGNINNIYNRQWLVRTATGSDWTTVEHVDGISVDVSYVTPGTSRTWWKRNPNTQLQSFGSGASTYLTITPTYTSINGSLLVNSNNVRSNNYNALDGSHIISRWGTSGVKIGLNDGLAIGAGEWYSVLVANQPSTHEVVTIASESGLQIFSNTGSNVADWTTRHSIIMNANTFTYGGNNIYHSGNLINVSQLINDAGYITSQTDNQTLSWNPINSTLSISNGNNVIINTFETGISLGRAGIGSNMSLKRPSDGNTHGYFGYLSADSSDFGIVNSSGGGDIRFKSNGGSLRFQTHTGVDILTVNQSGNLVTTGGFILGSNNYTKNVNSYSSGNIVLDNGNTDSPGIHFYYGNNTNFGIDVLGSSLRFVTNLDETGNSVRMSLSNSGNLTLSGTFTGAGTGLTGTAASLIAGNATKLQTARSISLGTAVTSTATNFDGSANITIPITSVSEAYLSWGGRNLTGTYGPIDSALMPELSANRLAFLPASAIIIEYSRDGGSTWTDYGASDAAKINLLNGNASGIQVGGGGYALGTDYTNYQVRLTINTAGVLYTTLNKFIILLSTNGSSGSWCTVSGRLQSNYTGAIDTWQSFGTQVSVSGWSGFNVINVGSLTTFGNTPTSQYGQVRLTFGQTGYSPSYSGLTIIKILGFGGVGWQTPSTLAGTGLIYTYDYLRNVVFPANVQGTRFISTQTTGTAPFTVASSTVVSNLNSDLLDGYNFNQLPMLSVYDNGSKNGVIPTSSRTTNPNPNQYSRSISGEFKQASSINFESGSWTGVLTFASYLGTNASGAGKQLQIGYDANSGVDVVKIRTGYDTTWERWKTLYHSGNLNASIINALNVNADTVDSLHASSFLRSDSDDVFTGNLTTGANNHITFGPNTTWGASLRIGGNGRTISNSSLNASIVTTNGNIHIDPGTGMITHLNYYSGTGGVSFGSGAGSTVAWMSNSGLLFKGSSSAGNPYIYDLKQITKATAVVTFSSFKGISHEVNTSTDTGYISSGSAGQSILFSSGFGNTSSSYGRDFILHKNYNSEDLYFRAFNLTTGAGLTWRKIYHSGNSNNASTNWIAYNLDVANDLNVGLNLTVDGPSIFYDDVEVQGSLTVTNIDTGQGLTEVHLMNQNVRTTDYVSFGRLNTTEIQSSGNLWIWAGSYGSPSINLSQSNNLISLSTNTSISGKVSIGNTNSTYNLDVTGTGRFTSLLIASSFSTPSGSSTQFLKADGSLDSTAYLTSASLGSYAKWSLDQNYTAQQYFTSYVLSIVSSTVAWNCSIAQKAELTINANCTLSNPTNMRRGATYTLVIKQDGTGGRVLSYGTMYEFGLDGAPTLSSGGNKTDILVFESDGTRMFFIGIKKGFNNYTATPV